MTALVFTLLVLGAVLAVVLLVARPWDLPGLSPADQLRIGATVSTYDFWLGRHGVPGRRRRALRGALRATLWDAAHRVGGAQAVRAVGSIRALARQGVDERQGPMWGLGVAGALVALELVVLFQVLVAGVVIDTAQAGHLARVDVPVTLVPGMTAHYERSDGGFSVATTIGPACLVVALVVFLLVARPWRLLTRR